MNFELHYYHALMGVVNQSVCGLWHMCVKEPHFRIELLTMLYMVREPGVSIGTNFGSKAHSDF